MSRINQWQHLLHFQLLIPGCIHCINVCLTQSAGGSFPSLSDHSSAFHQVTIHLSDWSRLAFQRHISLHAAIEVTDSHCVVESGLLTVKSFTVQRHLKSWRSSQQAAVSRAEKTEWTTYTSLSWRTCKVQETFRDVFLFSASVALQCSM